MTKTPKRQSLKAPLLFLLLFVLPYTGLFVYASQGRPGLLRLLLAGLVGHLAYLARAMLSWSRLRAEIAVKAQDFREQRNLLTARVAQKQKVLESLAAKIVRFSLLKELTDKLCLSMTLGQTAETLCRETGHIFGGKDTAVILYSLHPPSAGPQLLFAAGEGGALNIKDKTGDLYDQWVAHTIQPLLIEDSRKDFRFDPEKNASERRGRIRSLMSVPLVVNQKALGILRVDAPGENFFSLEDIRLLNAVGDVAAVALENAHLFERIEEMAIRDGLTGLFLRRYLLERLNEEISRQLRRRRPLAFLMIDLDNFKQYNDRFGHPGGDIALKAVASALTAMFGASGNCVSRYGGEEFAVLLSDCDKKEAAAQAEAFRQKVSAEPVILRREKTFVTVSVGVAAFPADAQFKEELVGKADLALYKAKADGRNRVCVFGPGGKE